MKTRLVEGVEVHRGSGNVFADPPQRSLQTWRGSRRTFVRLMHDNA
jgi:hypothetical protein